MAALGAPGCPDGRPIGSPLDTTVVVRDHARRAADRHRRDHIAPEAMGCLLELMRRARGAPPHPAPHPRHTRRRCFDVLAGDCEMDLTPLGRGLVLGFTIAAAVGPITLLCIRRTLGEGRVVRAGVRPGCGHRRRHIRGDRSIRADRRDRLARRLAAAAGPRRRRLAAVARLEVAANRAGRGPRGPDAARRPDRRLPARRTNRGCAPRTSRRSCTATNCYSVTSELVVGQSTQAGSMVGAAGFEPAISCSQSTRVARLRHAPTL